MTCNRAEKAVRREQPKPYGLFSAICGCACPESETPHLPLFSVGDYQSPVDCGVERCFLTITSR